MGLKIVRIDEDKEQAYQEYVAGYKFAKHARAKNKIVPPEEETKMSDAFRQGYRKGLNEDAVMEGPMDFMRGVAGAAGQKVGQAVARPVQAVKRNVKDVVQAGRTASAVGDLSKAVQRLAQLMMMRDKLKAAVPQTAEPQQTQQAAPAPQQKPQSAAPEAFRTDNKTARFVPGKHGPEYTFNSFIHDMAGEQINEGMWDFVKGAGAAVADKARAKINDYAERNKNWLTNVVGAGKEVIDAGRQASAAGNAKKATAQFAQVDQEAKQQLTAIVDQITKLGANGQNALKQAISTLPRNQRDRLYQTISNRL